MWTLCDLTETLGQVMSHVKGPHFWITKRSYKFYAQVHFVARGTL